MSVFERYALIMYSLKCLIVACNRTSLISPESTLLDDGSTICRGTRVGQVDLSRSSEY